VDDDCDGHIDERLVCADGSGHFGSLAEVIEEAPDVSLLLLCEGVHSAGIALEDVQLEIRGETTDLHAVIVHVETGTALTITGDESNVQLSWRTLQAGSGASAIQASGEGELRLDTVFFAASARAIEAQGLDALTVLHSWFQDSGGIRAEEVGDAAIFRNVFMSSGIGYFEGGSAAIHHNVGTGSSRFEVYGSETMGTEASFHHNTLADFSSWRLRSDWDDFSYIGEHYESRPEIEVWDNIFAFIDSGCLWDVQWVTDGDEDTEYDITEVQARAFEDNVIFQVPDPLSSALIYMYSASGWEAQYTDTSLSARIEYDNIFVDPGFVDGPEGQGSYALSDDSLAAGKGAFAEDIDWWLEVPWQLP
jgi:hypothetical protein